jgi:hypothetical protein
MPQVPSYDSFQAAPAPLPDARVADVRPGNSALQIGQALDQTGAVATDAAVRLQERANADAVFKAEADLKDQYLQFEQGVRQRRGTQAWGVTNDASQWWDKNTKAISDNLQNDRQRNIFMHSASNLRSSSLTSISQYENEQQHASVEDSAKASITRIDQHRRGQPDRSDYIGAVEVGRSEARSGFVADKRMVSGAVSGRARQRAHRFTQAGHSGSDRH